MKKILLVDDEQNVLNALQRELKDLYEIEAFDNPVVALEHCRNTQFDLVLADYKMPKMNGVEFLEQFGRLQPDASRLVLSGEADIDALIRMINETHIYRFLSKPWKKAELLSSIQQALDFQDAVLENFRQAETLGENRTIAQSPQDDAPFRIVLVESDNYLLNLMYQKLTDESGHEDIFAEIQQETKQDVPVKRFRCLVDGFQNAQTALTYIENNHCDLVISAQTLPDMEGGKLLGKVRQFLPDASLLLLCDDIDKSMLSPFFNDADLKALFLLQWVSYELRTDARRQAWNLHRLKTATIHALACRKLLPGDARLATII